MKGIRYTAEFKAEAIKQITERGYSATEVTKRYTFLRQWVETTFKIEPLPADYKKHCNNANDPLLT